MREVRDVIAEELARASMFEGALPKEYYPEADAILTSLSSAGLAVVPVEPTKQMIDAVEAFAGEQAHNRFKAWWRAALSALPPLASGGG